MIIKFRTLYEININNVANIAEVITVCRFTLFNKALAGMLTIKPTGMMYINITLVTPLNTLCGYFLKLVQDEAPSSGKVVMLMNLNAREAMVVTKAYRIRRPERKSNKHSKTFPQVIVTSSLLRACPIM